MPLVTLLASLSLSATPATDLPIAAAGTEWLGRHSRPGELLKGAHAALDRWGDPRRITADFYVPEPLSELVVALVAGERAREEGEDADDVVVASLGALADAWTMLGATTLLAELGHDFPAAYPPNQREAVSVYLRTLEQLPAFLAERLPAEAEALLAKDPKNIEALRALTRWELARLHPAAALPWAERLAAVSEEANDHLMRTRALVLSAEHDADAKGAVSALVRRFPETAIDARDALASRAPFREWGGPEAEPSTTLEAAVAKLGPLGHCVGPRHPALGRAMLDVKKRFPGPDGDAMGVGWLMLLEAYTLATAEPAATSPGEPVTALARGVRFSLGMVGAAQRLFSGGDDVPERVKALAKSLQSFPEGYSKAVAAACFDVMLDLSGTDEGKAVFAAFQTGEPEGTKKLVERLEKPLEQLRSQHKTAAGPYVLGFLLRFLSEPEAFAASAETSLASLEKNIAEKQRSAFDWNAAVFLLRLGRRPGHEALLGLAEARAMRIVDRFEAFLAGVTKLPAGSTETCPKTGCADIPSTYALIGAARNARWATLSEDEQVPWDLATISLMRKAERQIAEQGATTRPAHAEVMSHRCIALFHRGDLGAVEQCVSDLIDAHPNDVVARALVAALYAGGQRGRERAYRTFLELMDPAQPGSLRLASARWAAGLAYNLDNEAAAAQHAELARTLRGELEARGDAPALSHDLVDSSFQVSLGFELDGDLTARIDVGLRTGSLLRAPLDDAVLDGLIK